MKCQHALFDVTRHDYCPTCGETNFDKILDERYIVGLSAETARLLKENERLKAWKDQARYWENQSDDLRKENIWLKEEIEDKESALDKMRAIIGERETLLWQCRENNERLQKDAERMQKENERLRDALDFYADPETYFAITVICDHRCGDFADDFSDDHGHPYVPGPRPGKKAREALANAENNNE